MEQSYRQAIAYLFGQFPNYQMSGGKAINFGLDKMQEVCSWLGNPHERIETVHIAGTNGKGSSAAMLASVVTASGYQAGLFTSPHLKDFRERIRINGQMIPEAEVVAFVDRFQQSGIKDATFFEISAAMAFWYFDKAKVDLAVIETGLGGRLDATNVVKPLASLITQIGLDHQQFLGNTVEKIAWEKAGIIKPNTPVVISGTVGEGVKEVFLEAAGKNRAPITFADPAMENWPQPLQGEHQKRNLGGVLEVVRRLQSSFPDITEKTARHGLEHAIQLSGIRGRWEKTGDNPAIYVDVGHNENGVAETIKLIKRHGYKHLRCVWGMVEGKDVDEVLGLFPRESIFYICAPKNKRAFPTAQLSEMTTAKGFVTRSYPSVVSALEAAKAEASNEDLIIVGGSTFTVAEAL
jgi:dihydrofolate synthase/folylpolyglutamate synthase